VIIKVLWGLGRGLGGVCSRERMRIGGRVQSAGGGFRRGCGMDGHVTIAMVGVHMGMAHGLEPGVQGQNVEGSVSFSEL
jgi:hypothetical protein